MAAYSQGSRRIERSLALSNPYPIRERVEHQTHGALQPAHYASADAPPTLVPWFDLVIAYTAFRVAQTLQARATTRPPRSWRSALPARRALRHSPSGRKIGRPRPASTSRAAHARVTWQLARRFPRTAPGSSPWTRTFRDGQPRPAITSGYRLRFMRMPRRSVHTPSRSRFANASTGRSKQPRRRAVRSSIDCITPEERMQKQAAQPTRSACRDLKQAVESLQEQTCEQSLSS